MKTFIIALIILGVIVGLLLIAGLFLRKDYAVAKKAVINRPKAEVFDYVKLLKNQNNYSTWSQIDPNMKNEYRGVDGTVGFVSAWSSTDKNVGVGEQEILAIAPDRIDYEIRFIKPFSSVSPVYMTFTEIAADQTEVEWGFKGHMSYPSNLMLLFMNMEKMIGKDFETGLSNLKKILEEKSNS